jgi:plasmid stabilization system protein ParE
MQIRWSRRALSDLSRLHDFQTTAHKQAAARLVQALVAAPKRLVGTPRIGEVLEEFAPREVRRILVGRYEMRYELTGSEIMILRIWHTREDR